MREGGGGKEGEREKKEREQELVQQGHLGLGFESAYLVAL